LKFEECWAPVILDDGQCLIYGPRLGRLYLLGAAAAQDRSLLQLLGLAQDQRHPGVLADLAENIACDRANLKYLPLRTPTPAMRRAYRALHGARHLLNLRTLARWVARAAGTRPAQGLSIADIGQRLHGLEKHADFGNCYPRALLSAYFCLREKLPCQLTVGVLAPTRKMHVWCTSAALLPYEPLPEHYLYQPLWRLAISP